LQEKGIDGDAGSPPPGVPGVETMLPLLLTAVDQGKLALDDVIERCVHGPRRVYGLPEQPDTHIEVDVDNAYMLQSQDMHTKCGWTPYDGTRVVGRVEKVVLRGEVAVEHGEIRSARGSGEVIFWHKTPDG
jgi:carbamoyl-phosphate synthase/aspartate carbamoyltransferase/dihydroorotase